VEALLDRRNCNAGIVISSRSSDSARYLETCDPRGIADSVAEALSSMLRTRTSCTSVLPGKHEEPVIEIAGPASGSPRLSDCNSEALRTDREPLIRAVLAVPIRLEMASFVIVSAPIGFR